MSLSENKIPATVRVFTYNSEKTLDRALESVKDFAEILVIDGNSIDHTLEIARRYNARIEQQFPGTTEPQPITDWPAMVNRSIQLAHYDWVFYLDSDEELSSEALEEIRGIVQNPSPTHLIYQIPNQIVYCGKKILYATTYPGYQPRLVNKKANPNYAGGAHYKLQYDRNKYSIGSLKNPWRVFVESDDEPKERFLILEAYELQQPNWRSFLYWSVFRKLLVIANIFRKIIWIYMRHGFKDTMPPRVEFLKIRSRVKLLVYALRIRLLRQDLMKRIPMENR